MASANMRVLTKIISPNQLLDEAMRKTQLGKYEVSTTESITYTLIIVTDDCDKSTETLTEVLCMAINVFCVNL
jgi:hypothetical protein